jgi:hypothetical protein
MEEKIKAICEQIEKDKHIKIIFCVESGSRVWRMNSADSDYDVRFVFVRPLEEYLKLNKKDDVITLHFDKDGHTCDPENCLIDMCGFDIYKYSKMLSSSNPTTIEWLQSDIIYYGEKPQTWLSFLSDNINFKSMYYHYKSMCRQNYDKYLKSKNLVTYKKYLYAMRGLVNSKYISHFKRLPKIDFCEQIKELIGQYVIDVKILNQLKEIITLKKEGKEKDIIQNIVKLDNYIESFLKDETNVPENVPKQNMEILNYEILRQLEICE